MSKEAATRTVSIQGAERVSVSYPWEHLRNEFQAPPGIGDEHCHLMVVCMESRFLADKETLADFFGRGFKTDALPQRVEIEEIAKDEIYRSLDNASAHCKVKASYGKGKHSFLILKAVDPEKVAASSPWAARFLRSLELFFKG